jgi:hypothetical protein
MNTTAILIVDTGLLLATLFMLVALHNICNGRPKRSRP